MTNQASQDTYRSRDLRRIHAGQRFLGLDDDNYRDLLERLTGKRSAADLDPRQRRLVINEFYRRGYHPKNHRAPGTVPNDKLMGKIEALLADGRLPWAYADGIAKKMFGIESVRFCTSPQLHKIVAALSYNQQRRRQRA